MRSTGNSARHDHNVRLALFAPSLAGGGAERVTVQLANGFSERGFSVDLVLINAHGPYMHDLVSDVRVVDLKVPRAIASVSPLARYLRTAKPRALLSMMNHANVVAVAARTLARSRTPLLLRVQSHMSKALNNERRVYGGLLRWAMRIAYTRAECIVAVSSGVASDLAQLIGCPVDRIIRIYNPIVSPRLASLAESSQEHPWLKADAPPLVLGAGRLVEAKDFSTLIRAFAQLRARMDCRLVILGEGELRSRLQGELKLYGVAADAALPGFVRNPYAWMRRASVFALSSAWEGLGNVLIEAMACGAPVVSTDCASGPAEILQGGRWGRLVPVGDANALADALYATLHDERKPDTAQRAQAFSVTAALDGYLAAIAGLPPHFGAQADLAKVFTVSATGGDAQ